VVYLDNNGNSSAACFTLGTAGSKTFLEGYHVYPLSGCGIFQVKNYLKAIFSHAHSQYD